MEKEAGTIWHNMTAEKTAEELKTSLDRGLTGEEVEVRQKFGRNILPEEKRLNWLKILLSQFRSPLIYILLIAGIITLFLREFTDSIVILTAVLVNTAVGFFQELKASKALGALKKILKVKAAVLRQGKKKEVLQEDLVPGDIIILKTGHKVPADSRIFKAWNLKIREAVLTGEWLAAGKITKILPQETPLADRDNMAYLGTMVEEGEGQAIVVSTGQKTEIGKVAGLIQETKESKTPYQKKLAHFSKIVGVIITIMAGLIFIEGMVRLKELSLLMRFKEMFITAVAVAVAAIPEGLPVAMTVILSLGMQRILKKRGLVRKLAAAETLGSTSIIATDKTLTLTEGKMEVGQILSADKNLTLEIGALANEAFIENPTDNLANWKIRGRPTDKAMVLAAAKANIKKHQIEKPAEKLAEIPFNSQNKFIAVLYKITEPGKASVKAIEINSPLAGKTGKKENVLYVSGAPEKIINLSSQIKKAKSAEKLNAKLTKELNQQLEALTSQGLRVIAVAKKRTRHKNLEPNKIKGLTFVGFIGLRDPLRKEAKEAVALCQKAGMRPIIVTGDHLLTAKAVARELNLKTSPENIMLGKELDELSDQQLQKKLAKIDVFARVEPKHKLRIISAWQERNQVVAMTGDGVNDAPALKKADIGVALGSGTDVAKEVSDLILLNDNFSIIVSAVEEGRAILDKIRKVITYLLSDSFAEMLLISVSLLLGLPLPVTATQILWVNLIEDGLPSIALVFEPKEKDLMSQKPASQNIPLLTKEMKVIIFAIGIFTNIVLVGLFFWLYNKWGVSEIKHIRTVIFAGLTIDSLFYVFSCKSLRKNIWQINIFSNKFLLISWAFGLTALLGAIYLPFLQTALKTVPLGAGDWLILLSLGLFNLIAIEGAKYYFIARRQTEL